MDLIELLPEVDPKHIEIRLGQIRIKGAHEAKVMAWLQRLGF